MSPERMRRCVAKLMELGFGFGIGLNFQLFAFKSRCRCLCRSPHLMECTLEFINVPSFVRPSGALLHLYFILRFTSCTRTDTIFLFLIQASGGKMNEWMNEWNCRVRRQTKDAKRKKIMQIKSDHFLGGGAQQWSNEVPSKWLVEILPFSLLLSPQWASLNELS